MRAGTVTNNPFPTPDPGSDDRSSADPRPYHPGPGPLDDAHGHRSFDYAQPPEPSNLVPVDHFSQPVYYGGPPVHPQATTTLVLGVLGLVAFPPLALGALWLGRKGRAEVRANPSAYRDSGALNAGWILGIVGSVLCTLYIMLMVLIVLIAVLASA